jgi:hypothetical protein
VPRPRAKRPRIEPDRVQPLLDRRDGRRLTVVGDDAQSLLFPRRDRTQHSRLPRQLHAASRTDHAGAKLSFHPACPRRSEGFLFQSSGAVMGMDWHSSGIITSVLSALKQPPRSCRTTEGSCSFYPRCILDSQLRALWERESIARREMNQRSKTREGAAIDVGVTRIKAGDLTSEP